jgi:phosphohistidine swiveling domain-containing protein
MTQLGVRLSNYNFPNMELLPVGEIRDFRVRGNYFNQHSLRFRKPRYSASPEGADRPGYSPPVVEFDLEDDVTGTIVASEIDIPVLCQEDFEKAKTHLALIVNARRGDPRASAELSAAAHQYPWLAPSEGPRPAESRFVVPCTSEETHSEVDISHKGFILLKLSQQGYPVPDFVVLTSEAYAERAPHLEAHLADAIAQLEILTMQKLGDAQDPLVFAVRCATPHYIPGVMDTFLNVGVTERTLPCLEKMYGCAGARKMFLNNLRNLCDALDENYAALVSAIKSDLPPEEVARWIDRLAEMVRKTDSRLVDDAFYQAAFFARQAYKHFEQNLDLVATLCRGTEHSPSLILQKMVCTVRHADAYAGVLSSRHTQTGVGAELQTAHNIFGEEMMTGTAEIQSTPFEKREAIKDTFPAVYHFIPHLPELEREFESPVTIEFAVEATKRYQWFALLQLNETGMSGRAALISVVDLHKAGAISRKRVTELIRPYHIKQLTSDTIDQEAFSNLSTFGCGAAVLPRSAVSARVYFTGDAALHAKTRGEKVCLCKKTFVPTDTVVMREMDAILSLTSAAVHVVTICQSLGIPAILNLERHGVALHAGGLVNSAGCMIREGDWITISSRRRTIYQGQAKFTPARLLRYMRGEPVDIDPDEQKAFASIAYAYRYYQQLIRGLTVEQLSTLTEVTRLVNFDLRGESEDARQLVNGWFDDRESLYVEEVLKSDIGDHLGQSNVFDMLTLDRKIRFFKDALAKCEHEHISGYEAGAFMLGRFLATRYPVAFWQCFTPAEIGLLINEWVLFEKYMQLLHNVGERKVLQARKKMLKEGLDQLHLHPGNVQCLITLKLSGARLEQVRDALPEWSDPQAARVLELLQQPYQFFYNFRAEWSVGELKKICVSENLPVPAPEDV